MAIEQFANNAASTLSSSINNSVTSLTVASAAAFPAAGNFRIIVDAEIMLVTAVSTNTFTVTRAQEGTTATSHTSPAAVTHILTAGGLLQGIADGHPWCGVFSSSDSPTSGATWVFTLTATQDDGYLSSGTKLVAPYTGYYLFNAYLHWSSNSSGFRIAEWRVNGSSYINGKSDPNNAAPYDVRQEITALLLLSAGDYVELTCYQDSASTLSMLLVSAAVTHIKTTA
jgi:hypothetical protein